MRYRPNMPTIVITNADTIILPSHPHRKGVYFPPNNGGRYTINFGSAAVLDSGINISGVADGQEFLDKDWGCLVTREVHAIASVASLTIQLVEIFKEEWNDHDGIIRWTGSPLQRLYLERGNNARRTIVAMGG
jgi:hypothetical protein